MLFVRRCALLLALMSLLVVATVYPAAAQAPEPIVGLPLITSQCRKKFDVTVVGVKREGENFIHAVPDTIIFEDDELVVSGRIADIEKFSAI